MFIRLQVFLAIVSIVLATSLEENKVADLQASESYAPSYGYGYGISHGYGYGNHGGHSVVVNRAYYRPHYVGYGYGVPYGYGHGASYGHGIGSGYGNRYGYAY